MKLYHEISDIPPLPSPIALTIGNFDGLHLGHIHLIKRLKELTQDGGTSVILTFANHPAEVLYPTKKIPLLTTLEHKLHLFKEYEIDATLLLTFTKEFAELSYESFIHNLREKLPFNHLILGEKASFGKNREGDKEHLKSLAESLNFEVEYLPKLSENGEPISSGRLRKLIQTGELEEIEKLLGRSFSLYFTKDNCQITRSGDQITLTAELNLCSPPPGLYQSQILIDHQKIPSMTEIKKTLSHSLLIETKFTTKETIFNNFQLNIGPFNIEVQQIDKN